MIKKKVLILLIYTGLSFAVFAQTDETKNAAEPLVVITGQRVPVALAEYSGNLAILDEEVLQLTAHTHIQESLNRIAGVNFHRNNGQEYLPSIRSAVLTGPGACGSILMLENNVPLRPSGFCNVNELFESHTEQAKRIEIIRGPGTPFYGSNALHGVINVLSPATTGRHLDFSVEQGPHNFNRLGLSAGTDTFGLSFTASNDGGYREDSGYAQQKLSARHLFQNAEMSIQTDFSATNLNQETAGFISGYNAYLDDAINRSNPNPEAYRDAASVRISSRIELSSGWLFTPYARYNKMAFLQHFLPGDPLEENGHTSLGLQSSYGIQTDDLSSLSVGLDMEYADVWLRQSQPNPTQGSAFLVETIPVGKHYDYQVDAILGALFAQYQRQLTDALTIDLGLRLEMVNYKYNNRMLDGRTREDGSSCGFGGCRYSRPADSSDSFNNLSTKLGLLYEINETHQSYLVIAKGFRAPQMTELYRLQRNQTIADLNSVSLTSIELGFRGQTQSLALNNLNYEVNLYHMNKQNVIFRDTAFFNISGGKTRHQGLELSMSYPFHQRWEVGLATSFSRQIYTNNPLLSIADIRGNDLDTAPRHFGNAYLIFKPVDGFTSELQWVHMGKYYTDPENLRQYQGHDILNLRFGWQTNKKLNLFLKIINLTNEKYAERADYSVFSGDRYMPGESRGIYAGFEYQFGNH